MDMLNNQNYLTESLVKFNYSEPSNIDLAKHVGFNDNEINMLNMFWEPTFNKGWIYLSPKMILDMGYRKVSDFYNDTLRPNYTDNDYKEVDKNHELVKIYTNFLNADQSALRKSRHTGGKGQKYYIISGTAYKKMLMKCRTKKGDEICNYYIKVEELAMFMKEYISELHKHILHKKLEEKDNEIKDKDKIIKNKDDYNNRLYNENIELLSLKKLGEKDESIYILTTYAYAIQGIFKIGRTKCMKNRITSHNTTHVKGDKTKILKEYKVNDSTIIENYIHKKLKSLIIKGEREFFFCPYNLLENIISIIIDKDDSNNEIINNIIDSIYILKCSVFNSLEWTSGIDMNIFKDEPISNELQLISTDTQMIQASFDMSNATNEQKKEFIQRCVQSYKITISDNLIWKKFQEYLIEQLKIPKYKYKSLQWKPLFNELSLN